MPRNAIMTRLPRIVLLLAALVFFGFGVAFFVNPAALEAVDLGVESATARTEVRAMYGGLEIAFALFLGWCALAPERTLVGLLASGLVFLGIGAGRLGGILLAGESTALLWELFGSEMLAAALSFYGWWMARQLRVRSADEQRHRRGDQGSESAEDREPRDVSGTLVALLILAVVVAGAALAWFILPF